MTLKVLSLETTEAVGGVAACDGDNLLLELKLDSKMRSARSLAPGLKRLLEEVGWRPRDVELVGVTMGPGSFTGLRIGVVTAKTFAHAVGAEILGVDTLEVVAAGLPPEVDSVSVAVDAQRGQVVAGCFQKRHDGHFAATEPGRLLDVDTWLKNLPSGTWVSGPVLRKLCDRLPHEIRAVKPEYWAPSAARVAMLAARHYEAGKRHDVWKLTPRYSRPSAAEEKWARKEGGVVDSG
jgi:tRNA threonylcarbamoyladenosine biosynthesis protein TsaB